MVSIAIFSPDDSSRVPIFVNNHQLLVANFRSSMHAFGRVDCQLYVDSFADVFDHLAVKGIGNQFAEQRLEVGFCIFLPIVTILDKW